MKIGEGGWDKLWVGGIFVQGIIFFFPLRVKILCVHLLIPHMLLL